MFRINSSQWTERTNCNVTISSFLFGHSLKRTMRNTNIFQNCFNWIKASCPLMTYTGSNGTSYVWVCLLRVLMRVEMMKSFGCLVPPGDRDDQYDFSSPLHGVNWNALGGSLGGSRRFQTHSIYLQQFMSLKTGWMRPIPQFSQASGHQTQAPRVPRRFMSFKESQKKSEENFERVTYVCPEVRKSFVTSLTTLAQRVANNSPGKNERLLPVFSEHELTISIIRDWQVAN